ncbi:hypothetical protein LT493_26270 [Streptomyces tricolor]|nr:hypothetical protein [Streptomyces tricolor]
MINEKQKKRTGPPCAPKKPPADAERAGRTSCDEYPFASTYEGRHQPAGQAAHDHLGEEGGERQPGRDHHQLAPRLARHGPRPLLRDHLNGRTILC